MDIQKVVGRYLPWRWLVFFIFVVTFGVAPFKGAINKADEDFAEIKEADWGATNVWLQSAECARKTGAWLVICDGDRLLPIAHYALADDPGHAFLLGLKAKLRDRSMSLIDVARLNIWINFLGALSVTALLFTARAYVAALFFLEAV